MRQVAAFDSANPSSVLYKIDLDTSPAILIPYYDDDSSTLFLTGRVSERNCWMCSVRLKLDKIIVFYSNLI